MAPRPPRSAALTGILWMLASGLSFVGVTGVVRHLGTDLPAAQSAFLRFAWGVVFLLPAVVPLLRAGVPPGTAGKLIGRGIVHTAAVIFWFYAMARIPMAEVTAIGYLNPVLLSLGAALLLGEALAVRRLLAIAVAICGALIVLRPGLRELSAGHLSQMAAAACFAGSYLYAKALTRVMGAGAVVGWLSLTVTLGLAVPAALVWVPVSLTQLMWLAIVALCATSGHYCMTRAFAVAPIAVTQPVVFLQLVWATLMGSAVFGEAVDPFVILGGAVIVASVSWIFWRESRDERQRQIAAETA